MPAQQTTFVPDNEESLAERRTRKPVCATCPHACFCGGFYELESAPEPPWLVSAEDLVRPRAGT